MIKIVTGVVCALVALSAVSRYGAELEEDTFDREDGAPVKIIFYGWYWSKPPNSDRQHESPVFRRQIDKSTGLWGYSHVSIDAGETDRETGEPLIFDADDIQGVIRRPKADLAGRNFMQIELPDLAGAETYGAVRMMVGTPYSKMEFIGPSNERPREGVVCSSLIWHCLPQSYRQQIRDCKEGVCSFTSIPTPNQLARAFGLPKLERS